MSLEHENPDFDHVQRRVLALTVAAMVSSNEPMESG